MPTLHTIYRSGKITTTGIPRVYNLALLDHKKDGSIAKGYSLSNRVVTKIKDSVVKLFNERQYNITFWTYTFKIDSSTEHVVTSQNLMNKYFSKLLENTKKTFGLQRYVWVSERTEQGCIHYHCIFDLPFLEKKTQFKNYANYFKNSFRDYLSSNGVTTDSNVIYSSIGFPNKSDRHGNKRGAVVRDLDSVTRYLCGYLAKQSGRREYGGRIYGISRNTLQKPIKSYTAVPVFMEPSYTCEMPYCTVNFYTPTRQYDKIFLYYSQKKQYEVESDLKRKAVLEYKIDKKKYDKHGVSMKKTVKNQNLTSISRNLSWESVNSKPQTWTTAGEWEQIHFERSVRQAFKYLDKKYTAILT